MAGQFSEIHLMRKNEGRNIYENIRSDVHTPNGQYYTICQGDTSLCFTNRSGQCAKDPSLNPAGFIVTSFLSEDDPVEVKCPNGVGNCLVYCEYSYEKMCILLDSSLLLVAEYYITNDMWFFISYIDDTPSLDVFAVDCQGTDYPVVNYCAGPKTLALNFSCAVHVKISSEDAITDSYWMLYGNNLAYAVDYTHEEDRDYYTFYYFNVDNGGSSATYVSNITGSCTVERSIQSPNYFTKYEYYLGPVQVLCPDGVTQCSKYCKTAQECITVDSETHLLVYSFYDETQNYTYLDDAPTVDTFEIQCGDTHFSAANSCVPPNKVSLNFDCLTHFQYRKDYGSEEIYLMFDGNDLAYVRRDVFTLVRYTVLMYYDMEKRDGTGTAVFNQSGVVQVEQDVMLGVGSFSKEFEYHGEPEEVLCPDSVTNCKKFCNNVTLACVTIDSNMHMVLRESTDGQIVLMNDTPTIDTFADEIPGYNFTIIDYCAERSSSTQESSSDSHHSSTSPSSTGSYSSRNSSSSAAGSPSSHRSLSIISDGFMTKTNMIAVFAALVIALL